jgi:hypothetical protein
MAIKINGATVISDSQAITSTSTISATGNVTAGNLVTGGTLSVTGNITGGNIIGTIASGSSNISGGNIVTGGVVSATGNITGNYIIGNGSQLTGLPAGYTNANTATFLAAFGSNAISTTGNVNAGNVIATHYGSGAGLTSIPGANVTGTVASATTAATANSVAGANVTGTVASATSATSATTAGTVTTAAQGNITSVGTLTSLSVSGAVTLGGGLTNGQANGVGNIGSASTYFNTVFAKATSAQYADLAEMYVADAEYAPGTVVSFGGDQEVTISTQESDTRVAGVISTNPSYIMNSALEGEHVAAVALTGRVPTRVVGAVAKGDLMVSAGNGAAKADNNARNGAVIGKALENFNGAAGTIEVVVGRF